METPFVAELELRPIPPETVASTQQQIMPLIETALRDAGHADAITNGQVVVRVEQTFPVNEAIIVALTFLAGMGLEMYKFILDMLRDHYDVRERQPDGE